MLIATLFVNPALAQQAQQGNPAARSPATPPGAEPDAASKQMNSQDRLFCILAAVSGMAEVNSARAAEHTSDNHAVKEFARRMLQDHSEANIELAKLAEQARLGLPAELDPEHQTMQNELEKLSGPEFDLGYMKMQIQEHQKATQLLEWEIGSGQQQQLQRFATETLPKVMDHLQTAQQITLRLSSQAAGQPGEAATTRAAPQPQAVTPRGGRERTK